VTQLRAQLAAAASAAAAADKRAAGAEAAAAAAVAQRLSKLEGEASELQSELQDAAQVRITVFVVFAHNIISRRPSCNSAVAFKAVSIVS
jgi:hypothetical protein